MLQEVYNSLLKKYSHRGWWPLIENDKIIYHPKDYSYPKTREQEFEICAGVILTQNTSWKNAEKALLLLHKNKMLNPYKIIHNDVSDIIRSSGYYNQKAKKLKEFSKFFVSEFDRLKTMKSKDARTLLLSVKGIGKESADSILLY
ncbi:endonuclease III domain-containing protein, partial [Candidatus Pacearchaeota archaeon]|nr:endonuclease III domain-containing protein [Candidatus Pacearchaeota archaeon]